MFYQLFQLLLISARYQLGFALDIFFVNFQWSITVLTLSGSPSIILLSAFFFTEIISLTNLTVKKSAYAVLSNFSIVDDLMPTKVISDLIFLESLSSMAELKLSVIFFVNKVFKLFLSPFEKAVMIVS